MNETRMNKIENRYMKEVRRYLPFRTDNRKKILSTIQKGMQDYVHDHQITEYDSLAAGFGTPHEVVDHYIDESPSVFYLKKIRFIITVVVVSILLIFSISFGIAHYYYENTPAYIIEKVPVEVETFPSIARF